jgi:hypothetical protein
VTARTLPTMPTWTAGQEITSTLLNQITTYATFWANPPKFRMYQSVTQSIPDSTPTQITMDVSSWDSDSGRQGATPYNYVIPFAGRWRFTALALFNGNATGERQTLIYQNGAVTQGLGTGPNNGAGFGAGYIACVELACNVGDTIGVWAYQTSGAGLGTHVTGNQTSYFEGQLMSLANP